MYRSISNLKFLKISRYLLFTFVIFQFLVPTSGLSQSMDKLNISNIIPPTPEVAQLAKYTEFPMNYSAGLPEISIPLYTASSGTLEIPIALTYNASGIRVEEVASWVGLGWNLSVGPSLYRVVHGLPDDYSFNGFMYTNRTVEGINNYQEFSDVQVYAYNDIQQNILDVEPDIFYFTAMGYSGKFYYDQAAKSFVQMPRSQVRIQYNTNTLGQIVQWILTLPNGVKCYFGQSEDLSRSAFDQYQSSSTISFALGSGTSVGDGGSPTPAHITNWMPMEVKDLSAKSINFYYSSGNFSYDFGRGGEVTDFQGASTCEGVDGLIRFSYYGQISAKSLLQRVSFDGGYIDFKTKTVAREDLTGFTGAMDKILIRDNQGSLIKAFTLNTGYWLSSQTTQFAVPASPFGDVHEAVKKRLYLASLDERDGMLAQIQRYAFEYNTLELPDRLSTSQDFWGYFNGKQNGLSLSPKILLNSAYTAGAERNVEPAYSQARMLKSIAYPTGGVTTYTYENNRAGRQGFGTVYNNIIGFSDEYQRTANLFKSENLLRAGTSNIYERIFEVGETPTDILITYTGCSGNFNSVACPLSTMIQGISDPSFIYSINTSNFYVHLVPGAYKIVTTVSSTGFSENNADNSDFTVTLNWRDYENGDEGIDQVIVGGLRIKNIISTDLQGSDLQRSFSYNQFNNNLVSSGEITNGPLHIYSIGCEDRGFLFGSMVALRAECH